MNAHTGQTPPSRSASGHANEWAPPALGRTEQTNVDHVRTIARAILPAHTRRALRVWHRERVFRRALRRFIQDPDGCAHPGGRVLLDLIRGWGNEKYAAPDGYLVACIRHALVARGPILECGSGLSTILIAIVAKKAGQRHWALEHTPKWATKVQTCLDRYELDSVVVTSPLRDYGEFSWYEPPLDQMPDAFSLVICDGPPGVTKGGRYGLVPCMAGRLAPGCTILLDDAHREAERAIARRWEAELDAAARTFGSARPYVEMTLK